MVIKDEYLCCRYAEIMICFWFFYHLSFYCDVC